MTTATSSTPLRFGELAGRLRSRYRRRPRRRSSSSPASPSTGRCGDRFSGRSAKSIPAARPLALDMPGEGESVGTFRGLEAAIGQLHVAITAAGIENPVLVGHSGSAIGAMFYAVEHPVRGIVNVDAVLDNGAFSARLRALEPQLRNGGIPAIWDELFAGMHAERCGPAGEAMLRATLAAAPRRHARLLGAGARASAHSRERHRRRDHDPPRTSDSVHARLRRGARCRDTDRGWRSTFPKRHVIALPEQRALPPRRPVGREGIEPSTEDYQPPALTTELPAPVGHSDRSAGQRGGRDHPGADDEPGRAGERKPRTTPRFA